MPGVDIRYDQAQLASQFNTFAAAAECSGNDKLKCLRDLDSEMVQEANLRTVHPAAYGTFVYGPAIDNSFIVDLPGVLLQEGRFHKNVEIIVGHNRFTSFWSRLTEVMKVHCLPIQMFRPQSSSETGLKEIFPTPLILSLTKSLLITPIHQIHLVMKKNRNDSIS